MDEWRRTAAVVRNLAYEHLGPVPEVEPDLAAQVREILRSLPENREFTLSFKNCNRALEAAGISLSRRMLAPFRDDEILRRMGLEQARLRAMARHEEHD